MSDLVTITIIGGLQAVTLALINQIFGSKVKKVEEKVEGVQKVEKVAREELAKKLDDHSDKVESLLDTASSKMDTNTRITVAGSNTASKAYTAANSFNEKLLRIESEMKIAILELGRLGRNGHVIGNALTEVLGRAIVLEPRTPGAEDFEASPTSGTKP